MLHLCWVLRIALLRVQRQGRVPFSRKPSPNKQYISFLERDTTFFGYLQDILELNLVIRQRGVLNPILPGPGDVINEDSASSNPLFSPMLHTDTRATTVLNLRTSRAAIEDPLIRALAFRPRRRLREMAQTVPLTALLGIEGIRVVVPETIEALDDVVLEGLATEARCFELRQLPVQEMRLPVRISLAAALATTEGVRRASLATPSSRLPGVPTQTRFLSGSSS